MAIQSTDIEYRLSITSASAGDTDPQPDPNASLGKYVSTTEIDYNTPLHNLFDPVSGDEALAGHTDYRCIFVHNAHETLTLYGAKVWIKDEEANGATIAISVDATPASAVDASSEQAKTVPNETTAPADQTFTSPTSKSTGLSIGDLAAGEVRAIWIRRTVTAETPPQAGDGVTLRVEGDTDAE